MGRNRVGDAVIAKLSQEGQGISWSLCVLDGWMNDAACDLDPPLKLWRGMSPHPLNRAQVAASFLARDDRFEMKRIRACDSLGRSRLLRLFKVRPEFRPADPTTPQPRDEPAEGSWSRETDKPLHNPHVEGGGS